MYIDLKIPEPLATMMMGCETYCVAGCCGIDAFAIEARAVRFWADNQFEADNQDDRLLAKARDKMEALIEYIGTSDSDFQSDMLCHYATSAQWVELLTRWKAAIDEAMVTPMEVYLKAEAEAEVKTENVLAPGKKWWQIRLTRDAERGGT